MQTISYTKSGAAVLAGLSNPQVKKLGRRLLRKRGTGTGHHLVHDFDDVLRMKVARELLKLGVHVASIHSVFTAIESEWPRLRTPQMRSQGAALVVLTGPLGPNSATSRAYLTPAHAVTTWLNSKQTVIVIDVSALIEDLEQRTGEHYL